MDLHEFIKYGGSLEMATTIVKTNKLDVNKYHKRNGLAKLDYDYDDRQKLAHYKGQYFDMMKSEYTEEKPLYVVTFINNVADIVKKTFNKLENAMDYIDELDDDDFTTYDEGNWDCDEDEDDDSDEDKDENEDDSDLEGTDDSDNSDNDDESEDDDEKSDSNDSDWVDPDEEDD